MRCQFRRVTIDVVTSKNKAPISAGHFSIDVVTSKYEVLISVGHISIDVVTSNFAGSFFHCVGTSKYKAPISAGSISIYVVTIEICRRQFRRVIFHSCSDIEI